MQTDMGGYQPWQAGTSGSLKAYEPTWRDKLARVLMGEQRASPERARLVEGLTGSRGMGSPGIGVVDAVPGVGQALQAQEAVRSGDTDMLAMALMPGSKQVKAATGAADDAAKAGIRAYHGSPHDFDRFDMSKIGTGEGAQAYGHGLYFAESEGVAKSYRDALGGKTFGPKADGWVKWTMDGQPVDIANNPTHLAAWRLQQEGDKAKAIAALEREREIKVMGAQPGTPHYAYVGGSTYDQALAALKSGEALPSPQRPGRMYEVRINASPDDFLDWDKPLSQQSEKVRGAVRSLGAEKYTVRGADGYDVRAPGPDGRMTSTFSEADARRIASEVGGEVTADKGEQVVKGLGIASKPGQMEQKLRDAGIPGIRYLDQGSRTAGEGSRNYVVFRDDIIDIIKKYGIAAAASMYGMDQVQRVMLADQLQPAQQ